MRCLQNVCGTGGKVGLNMQKLYCLCATSQTQVHGSSHVLVTNKVATARAIFCLGGRN